MRREVETEEGEIVVQEIAHPNGQRIKREQWNVAHIFQRNHSLPDTTQRGLYLIIYR